MLCALLLTTAQSGCNNVPGACNVCHGYAYCTVAPDASCANAPSHCDTCAPFAHCALSGGFAAPPSPPMTPISQGFVPSVQVGQFSLSWTSDTQWTSDTYDQRADGSFTGSGSGTWDPAQPTYTYAGAMVPAQSSCASMGSELAESGLYWFQLDAAGVISWTCYYNTFFRNAAGQTLSTNVFWRGSVSSTTMASARAGQVPGTCPATAAQARAAGGISWMPDAQEVWGSQLFVCFSGCGAFACEAPTANSSSDDGSIMLIAAIAGGVVLVALLVGVVYAANAKKAANAGVLAKQPSPNVHGARGPPQPQPMQQSVTEMEAIQVSPMPAAPVPQMVPAYPVPQAAPTFPRKFDPETGEPLPKFDPQTGVQNW